MQRQAGLGLHGAEAFDPRMTPASHGCNTVATTVLLPRSYMAPWSVMAMESIPSSLVRAGVVRAIRSGRLAGGGRLPASRELARDLGMSRGVVVEVLNDPVCERLLADFIREHPALWDEDIGR